MKNPQRLVSLAISLFLPAVAHAATYIVPSDEALVKKADAIVVARALTSYVEDTKNHGLETVTVFAIEDALKSDGPHETLTVRVLGGRIEEDGHWRAKVIPGAPRFVDGERVLLFVNKSPDGDYMMTDFALGLFGFATDELGNSVAVRAETEISGWDRDGKAHREPRRSALRFMDFIRDVARGRQPRSYTIESNALLGESKSVQMTSGRLKQSAAACSGCSVKQYTLTGGDETTGDGYRWRTFPVNWNRGNNMTNATNNGADAINTGFSWWEGGSNTIDYVLASATANTNGIAEAPDGVNNIVFEKNNIGPTWSGCAGLFGIGGIQAQGPMPVMVGAESFAETIEADVSMNQGLNSAVGGCITQQYFTAAVAHEIGHTLGLRHTEKSRLDNQPCTNFPSYDCDPPGTALMTSTVSNLTGLAPWDIRAITALYPPMSVAAPTSVVATATSGTTVSIAWAGPGGTYEVHRSAANNAGSFSVVCTTAATSCTDSTAAANSAYLYKVRVGASGTFSAADLATTVVFTDLTLTAGVTPVKAVHITQLRTAVNAVQTLAGQANSAYTDNTIMVGVTTAKAAHINELRTRLNAARTALIIGTMSFTDPTLTVGTTRIKAVHIADLRLGVQ